MPRRRPASRATARLAIADLEVDCGAARVTRGGEAIELTPKEFSLLEYLLRHRAGVSRAFIAEKVWDYGFDSDTNVVDVHIRRLRKKVDEGFAAKLIHTVSGVGYVLEDRGADGDRPLDRDQVDAPLHGGDAPRGPARRVMYFRIDQRFEQDARFLVDLQLEELAEHLDEGADHDPRLRRDARPQHEAAGPDLKLGLQVFDARGAARDRGGLARRKRHPAPARAARRGGSSSRARVDLPDWSYPWLVVTRALPDGRRGAGRDLPAPFIRNARDVRDI